MIGSRFASLYNFKPYRGLIQRRQALTGYLIATALIVIVVVYLLLGLVGIATTWWPALVLIPAVATFHLIRKGRLRGGARILVISGVVGIGLGLSSFGWGHRGLVLSPMLLLILTGLLAQGVVVLGITLLCVALLAATMFGSGQPFSYEMALVLLQTVLAGGLVYALSEGWQRSLDFAGDQTARNRERLVKLTEALAARVFEHEDLSRLLADTVESIRDEFEDIYHAQVFLIDEAREYAVLRASSGGAGRQLLGRGHRLKVGSQSVIGQVTELGKPVLAANTDIDPIHRRNELLPDTRAELALPMMTPSGIMGALDVQSLQRDPFSPDDIGILQALANQIAIAVENASLLAEQQRAVEENRRLAEQSQHQLAQIQELNRQLTREAWATFVQNQDLSPALTVDFASGTMTPNAEWTPGLSEAIQGRVIAPAGDAPAAESPAGIAVPLTVRGQVIGAMEFELENGELNPEQAALVQDVATRLALALESTRLYEEAQRLARREAVINDIGARLQSAVGMESALVMAAQGLQTVLNAPRIAIRLGMPPDHAASDSVEGQAS